MAVPIYNLEFAAKEFGLNKDAIIDTLVSLGYNRKSISLNDGLSEEMMNALQIKMQQNAKDYFEDPIISKRIDRTVYYDSQAEAVIEEARKKKLTRLNLLSVNLQQLPLSILELKDQVTEILLGAPAIFGNKRPNNEISDLRILKVSRI